MLNLNPATFCQSIYRWNWIRTLTCNITYKQVLWDKNMNPVMCSFDLTVSIWVIANKNCTDRCWVFLSCSAPCCVCMQAPTRQGPEVFPVLTVQGLWLTCTDLAARIQLWATTLVLLALSLALGLAPASQWVLKCRLSVMSDRTSSSVASSVSE